MNVKRTKSDGFMLRLPDGMRDRIKDEAEKNNRSMNAEIVATLEEKYPPRMLDLKLLAEFLDMISDHGDENNVAMRQEVNDLFAKTERPYTVKDDFGAITFYPYASPSSDEGDEE